MIFFTILKSKSFKTSSIIAMGCSLENLKILPFIDKNTMIKTPALKFS